MIFQDVISVAIKNGSVLIAHLKGSFSGVKLCRYVEYARESEQSMIRTLIGLDTLIADFKKENKIGKAGIFIGISEKHAVLKKIILPAAVKENLRPALTYEMEKYIPLSVDKIYFDCRIIEENKVDNLITVLLVVIKKEDLEPFFDLARTIAGGISSIEVFPTAMANCISYFSSSSFDKYVFDFKKITEYDFEKISGDADSAGISKAGISTHDQAILFGLGLKGLIKNCPDINLLPYELRQRPGRMGYYIMFFLMAVMIISGLIWGGAWFLNQKYQLKRLDAKIETLAREMKKVNSLESEAENLEKKLDNILAIRQKGVPVIDILRELSQIIPKDAWVRGFMLTGDKIQIEGFAGSASGLISLLEASPIIKNVVFLSAITKSKNGKEKFRIGFETEISQ